MTATTTAPPAEDQHARPGGRFWRWVGLFAALGLAIRFGHLFLLDHDPLHGDGFGYVVSARSAANGDWFLNALTGEPSADHPPLWTLLLSVAAVLGLDDLVGFQVLASLIGTASLVAVAAAGRRIAGDRVGIITAAIAAVYPGFWLYERIMLSETLLFGVLGVFLLIVYRFIDRPSAWGAAAVAFVGGLAALTRSEQVLLAVFVIAPLLLTRRSVPLRRRALWSALAAVVFVATIAPWSVYNIGRVPEPVVLSTQSSTVVAIANCENAYYGPTTGWFDIDCMWRVSLQSQNDPGSYPSVARNGAFTYARDNAGRLPVVVIARIGRTFGFWAPFQQTELEWETQNTGNLLPRTGLVMYWLLLPLTVVGGLALRRRRIALFPLLGLVGVVLFTTTMTLGESRYRAAAEVSIVILAATGIDDLLRRRVEGWRGAGRAPPRRSGERGDVDDPRPIWEPAPDA